MTAFPTGPTGTIARPARRPDPGGVVELGALRRLPAFADLPGATLAALGARIRVRVAPAGTSLIAEGEEGGPVHLLLSGRVEVVTSLADGRRLRLHEAGPGTILGEMAALDGSAAAAEVRCLAVCRVGTLSQAAFLDLLATQPDIAFVVLREAATRIRRQNRRAAEAVALDAGGRVAAELLRVAEGSFRLDPTPRQRDIASTLGLRRETVVREFGHLAREGALRRDGTTLWLDLARLAARAEEPELVGARP